MIESTMAMTLPLWSSEDIRARKPEALTAMVNEHLPDLARRRGRPMNSEIREALVYAARAVVLRSPWTAGLLAKVAFNYFVPFVVSSASASANRERRP
jgi:hypothetical protein